MADDDALLPDSVVQHVNENLTESGYPVGAKVGQMISHTLIVRVGSIVHSSTPAGFSFAIGNADPRALDFQKTDVLPVNCTLTAITHPEQVRDLDMNFTASATDRKALAKDKLTDHISTVCFNLLRDVKWPQAKLTTAVSKTHSSWIPEVQIETKETPIVTEKTAAESSPVASEPRKEMIIHNQGSPMILHFGHERR
ncbi:MAG: hypothetical protein NTV00_03110 [Methylococcales bacterium]|nr:hypothetical protein [Methylococcales bacterium]